MRKTASSLESLPTEPALKGQRRSRVAAPQRLVSAKGGNWNELLLFSPLAKPAKQAARKHRRAVTRPGTSASRWPPQLAAWMAEAIRELAGWSSPPAGSVAPWGGSLLPPMAAATSSQGSR